MRGFFTHPIAWLTLVLILVLVGVRAPATAAQPSIQLAIVLDGSSSIHRGDFRAVTNGLADAIGNSSIIPQDGSVEITVVQFAGKISGLARVECPPTVITNATVNDVVNCIRNIKQAKGNTPMANGIELARQQITGSGNFTTASRRLINLVTDGDPNIPLNGDPNKKDIPRAKSDAIDQSNEAKTDGIDEFDAEGIGRAVTNSKAAEFVSFLCNLVYPQPCEVLETPLSPGTKVPPGFVIKIPKIKRDFPGAIADKLNGVILRPPLADAGKTADHIPNDDHPEKDPYVCQKGNPTIQLNGTGSFAKEEKTTIVKFEWDLDNDGSFEVLNNATPTTSCPSEGGSKTVMLRVTDSNGLTSTDDAIILPPGPTADADGPYVCEIDDPKIQLDGTGSFSEDGATIVKFEWDLDNNGSFETPGATPLADCPPPGIKKTVKLKVTDSNNLVSLPDEATITTKPLCVQDGKLNDRITELLQKGGPFKDLFVELGEALQNLSDELGDIASSIEIDPTDTDLQDALDRLNTIGSVVDFFQAFLNEIKKKRLEFLCEIDVLKRLLPAAIADGEFGRTTGNRILHQLAILKRTLDQLGAQALPALEAKLQQADDALSDAVSALEHDEAGKAFNALQSAQRSVDSALTDVDRMLHKQLSQILKALLAIDEASKIEQNNHLVQKHYELWMGIEQGAFLVRGTPVRELTVELYTLGGTQIAQSHSRSDHLALEALMGPTRPNGVYLYVVKITDDDGRSWQSKLNKLIWTRH